MVKLFQKSIDRWIWNKQIPTLSLLLGTSFPTSSQAFKISLLNIHYCESLLISSTNNHYMELIVIHDLSSEFFAIKFTVFFSFMYIRTLVRHVLFQANVDHSQNKQQQQVKFYRKEELYNLHVHISFVVLALLCKIYFGWREKFTNVKWNKKANQETAAYSATLSSP